MDEAPKPNEYRMTYIGKGLYTVAQFVAEAEKHGVARAMPQRIVKTLTWGDPILLAQWRPDVEAQRATMVRQTTLMGETPRIASFERIGAAEVFGFFRVTGLNFDGLKEMKEELVASLRVTSTVDHGEGGVRVSRRCGGYGIAVTYFVEDSIQDILTKAEPIQEKYGTKFKFFVTGRYEPINQVVLDPASFSRGIVKVLVEGLSLAEMHPGDVGKARSLNYLLDYKKRAYVKKDEEPTL